MEKVPAPMPFFRAIDFRNNCRVASDCGTYRGVTHDTPLTAPLALTRRHGYGLSYNTLRAFPRIPRAEALMFQFPPQPDMPLNPPGPAMRFFACLLIVFAAIELILFNLPDKWSRWTARRKRSR
jgi:hypothetical protein